MAANKFATMLHRNTHKLTLILVYALLEWFLIFLLLLNSLFTYLIAKFAKYFGLKPPCQWCSRLDHFLEPNKNINPYTDLVCEAHAMEISSLRYCTHHQNLAESQTMCTGCSSSHHIYNEKSVEISPKIAFFTWVSEKTVDHGEENHRCSCCDEKMNSKIYPPYLVLKPSWDVLEYTQKLNLITEAVDSYNNGGGESSDTSESDCPERDFCQTPGGRYSDDATMLQKCYRDDDESLEVMNLVSRSGGYYDFGRLIPVELIDSSTVESQTLDVVGNFVSEEWIETQVELVNKAKCTQAEAMKLPAVEEEDDCKLLRDETVSKTMIGTKVSDHELPKFSMDNEEAKSTTGLDESIVEKDQGSKQLEKAIIEERSFLASNNHEGINHHLSSHLEPKELEEDKFPFAPTYMDGLHQPHKKLLQFEKREPGAEESWDGSVISEMDGDDGAFTIEQLRSALKAERKALSALYTELEEERSAAAIAANQTMAMITRVQEEKAAMQMEALQYQRMMEEQSEYDQEALQLLNELMIKREKEKQELEKELELYRKKVLDYEAKDNLTMLMRRKSDELLIDQENGSFHAHQESSNNNSSPANAFVDSEKMGLVCMNHLTTLDESLAEFEEERMSILEELKALEEKLFILADDEEQPFEHFTLDVKPVEPFTDDYGKVFDEDYSFSSPEETEISNGFSEDMNGNHYPERKSMGSTSKKLLPLFDAAGIESEEGEPNEEEEVKSHSTGVQNSSVNRIELGSKKVFIEEEVDHVYERLLALEADREFLKHCVSSLKKGDKGMDLLQEILQHLRDLRTVELRVRNIGDSPFTCSST